jgi:hypothetical protein
VTIYEAHQANADALSKAFGAASRSCKEALRRADPGRQSGELELARLLTCNVALVLGAKLEEILLAAIHNPHGFTPSTRSIVLGASDQKSRWKETVRCAFAQRRGIAPAKVPGLLTFTERARYNELQRIIEVHIFPLIELRNSLAHGQWARAFTSDGLAISAERTGAIHRLTLWELMLTDNLSFHLFGLLFDALVTHQAFERDFDQRWDNLRASARRIERGDPTRWHEQLRARFTRREAHIAAGLRSSTR